MYKLRYRLVFAVIVITLLVMSGLGWTIVQLYESYYFHSLTDRLEKEAHVAAAMLEEQGFQEEVIEQLAENLAVRLTVITKDGIVIKDTHADSDEMDNHATRPEIEAIVDGQIGASIRYSETLQEEMLYYAVPVGENLGYVRLGLPTTMLQEMHQRVWTIVITSFTIAFFIIVFIISRVAGQLVRPIEQITSVAKELAKGNYRVRTSEERDDEVGQLTKAMNMLAYQLDEMTRNYEVQREQMATLIENMGSALLLINTRGEIVLVNQACRDIFAFTEEEAIGHVYYDVVKEKEVSKFVQAVFMTEQKQRKQVQFSEALNNRYFDLYGAPILNKKEQLSGVVIVLHDITELKKLEQIRKDFVANVSHELKTPVTSIKGFAETLLDGAMEERSLREKFLNIIYKESERLQLLVHDLLELSKIEQPHFTLNWQKIELRGIVEEVIELLSDQANESGVHLHMSCDGDTVIDGDDERLKQIVINLVENALTYTPAGGRIDLTLTGLEKTVLLVIKDTGIGIDKRDLPRIFERFYRVDRARTRQSGGTGLGLAIVKHLIEAHGAIIDVESVVGKGTTFTLTFNRVRKEKDERMI